MNIGEAALRGKTINLVFAFVLLVGGLISFGLLGRLEDPSFTIKDALIITPYPGATAEEVEEEVSDEIELAVQKLGQTDYVHSRSEPGLSIVTVTIKKTFDKTTLPQVWDEVRRKVNDAQPNLPPGAGPSVVNDDYGDVYGIFVAISGEDYSLAELEQYLRFLRRELLLVEDVAKIELVAVQKEAVYIEIAREKAASYQISPGTIAQALRDKNLAADAGLVEVGPEMIRVDTTGSVATVKDFEDILVSNGVGGAMIRLGDFATVRRGFVEPADMRLRAGGKRGVGLAISTVQGGNVVTMGERVKARMAELEPYRPVGVNFDVIAMEAEAVTAAIGGFVINLIEAVAIVVGVLLIFMGLRSGIIIGVVLVLTICGTFILMAMKGVTLERISLGALVIALGMLVDNAIVVTDGVLIGLRDGESAEKAAARIVGQTAFPLLIATVIAILSFAAIGTSDDSTGEYCGSLYSVILYSLGLSWVTAVTITPVLCVMYLKPPKQKGGHDASAPHVTLPVYQRILRGCVRFKVVTISVAFAMLALSLYGFGYVKQSFFPDSTRPQFMVDFWMPRGTDIDETEERIAEVEAWLTEQEHVTQVASVVGNGAPRFILTYSPEKQDSGYAQLLVTVDDYRAIADLEKETRAQFETRFTDGQGNTKLFRLGPGTGGKVQLRLSGPDRVKLRELSTTVMDIMREEGAVGVRSDWRQPVKSVRAIMLEEQARENGIEPEDIARTIQSAFEGTAVGVFREGDDLLPIIARAPEHERGDITNIQHLQIWSPRSGGYIPLRQVVADFKTVLVDDLISRRDRLRTATIHSDPDGETADELLARVLSRVDELELPMGYSIEVGGEAESSEDAQNALKGSVVIFGICMVLMTVLLFNAIRQPIVIWLCVPMTIIGVTVGLLSTSQPFGFMALLGLLSLVGMLIKNAIVLIDEIDLQIRQGKPRLTALTEASASRVRPVMMAALTTMLGMLPLFTDAFFVSMAVTIVFGLGFGTLLTLVVVPTLYAMLFAIRTNETG